MLITSVPKSFCGVNSEVLKSRVVTGNYWDPVILRDLQRWKLALGPHVLGAAV